jgi:hypothetical protein
MMFSLPLTLLLAATAAPRLLDAAQNPARPGTEVPAPEAPQLVHSSDPEFNSIWLRYEAAVHEYDDLRMRKNRKGIVEAEPPHPARKFHAEFLEAARRDSGAAQGWVIENLDRRPTTGRSARASCASSSR